MNNFEILSMLSEIESVENLAQREVEQAEFDEYAFIDEAYSAEYDEFEFSFNEDDSSYSQQVAESLLAEQFSLQKEELKHLSDEEINAMYMADDLEYEDDLPW